MRCVWIQDGYWECTDRLSSFLNLDIDFFANVFLKEKGIRSFGKMFYMLVSGLVHIADYSRQEPLI